jgi:hypothetical protein
MCSTGGVESRRGRHLREESEEERHAVMEAAKAIKNTKNNPPSGSTSRIEAKQGAGAVAEVVDKLDAPE